MKYLVFHEKTFGRSDKIMNTAKNDSQKPELNEALGSISTTINNAKQKLCQFKIGRFSNVLSIKIVIMINARVVGTENPANVLYINAATIAHAAPTCGAGMASASLGIRLHNNLPKKKAKPAIKPI